VRGLRNHHEIGKLHCRGPEATETLLHSDYAKEAFDPQRLSVLPQMVPRSSVVFVDAGRALRNAVKGREYQPVGKEHRIE
jgi:hypothetical protein